MFIKSYRIVHAVVTNSNSAVHETLAELRDDAQARRRHRNRIYLFIDQINTPVKVCDQYTVLQLEQIILRVL